MHGEYSQGLRSARDAEGLLPAADINLWMRTPSHKVLFAQLSFGAQSGFARLEVAGPGCASWRDAKLQQEFLFSSVWYLLYSHSGKQSRARQTDRQAHSDQRERLKDLKRPSLKRILLYQLKGQAPVLFHLCSFLLKGYWIPCVAALQHSSPEKVWVAWAEGKCSLRDCFSLLEDDSLKKTDHSPIMTHPLTNVFFYNRKMQPLRRFIVSVG